MNNQKEKLSQPGLPRGFVGWIVARIMPLPHSIIYRRVSKVLNLQPKDDIIDIACGSGHFLKRYAYHIHSVAGLDLSYIQVKMAKRKLRKRIAEGTAEIVQGDASQLPWDDNRFSVATTMGSFIGFPKSLESLKEIYRVLRPGGRTVVSIEHNAEDGKDHSKEIEKHGMHVWTAEQVRTMMKEAGFSEISITYDKGLGMPHMMLACGIKK